jgi:hypothetical protein
MSDDEPGDDEPTAGEAEHQEDPERNDEMGGAGEKEMGEAGSTDVEVDDGGAEDDGDETGEPDASDGPPDSDASDDELDTDAQDERPGNEWTPSWLADLRANDDRRHAALVAVALVGLGAAMVHWAGLFVAGALVGLASKTFRRAPVAGLAVGVLVLVVHVGASPVMGPGEFLALAPAAYVTVAVALVAPVWGSLVRGVL